MQLGLLEDLKYQVKEPLGWLCCFVLCIHVEEDGEELLAALALGKVEVSLHNSRYFNFEGLEGLDVLLGLFGEQSDGLALGEGLAQLDLIVHGERLGTPMVQRMLVL